MGSEIVIMNNGRMMQVGKPIEVYDNPDNIFVAGFIGSPAMNFLEVELIEKDGALWVSNASFRLPVPDSKVNLVAGHKNEKFLFGIRPEHIYDPSLAGEVVAAAHIEAVVDVFEPVGSEVILLVSAGDRQMTAKVDPRTSARAHHPIELCVDMGRMHLFDKTTGKVIDET